MSYVVGSDSPVFSPNAGVLHTQGYGPGVFGCIQSYEPCALEAVTATTFAANSFNTIFIAPPAASQSTGALPLGQKYQVVGVSWRYGVAAAGAATATVEICPAGTADGSGNNVLAATNIALNTAASNTPTFQALNSNVDNLIVLPGGRINVNAGSTATTGLSNFTLMVYLARLL